MEYGSSTFLEFVEACRRVEDSESFAQLIRHDLVRVLPHRAMICGVGHAASGTVARLINVGFPERYVRGVLQQRRSVLRSPLAKLWYDRQLPLVRAIDELREEGDGAWGELAHQCGIEMLAVHGQRGDDQGGSSYFCFSCERDTSRQWLEHSLAMVTPHLHEALRAIAGQPKRALAAMHKPAAPAPSASPPGATSGATSGATPKLTRREVEILVWVRNGKTNDEIGTILGISRFTVKNHIQQIFRKLDVLNRAQAIGVAVALGLFARSDASTASPKRRDLSNDLT